MIEYVVRVWVQTPHAGAWRAYMGDQHIDEVLATGCFAGATFSRRPEADTPTEQAFQTVYGSTTEDFARYNAEFGAALKADHSQKFGSVVRAEREIMQLLR